MNHDASLQFEIGRDGALRRAEGAFQKTNPLLNPKNNLAATTIPSITAPEIKILIQHALDHGWIRKPDPPPLKLESYQRRQVRAQWRARGLNSSGKPRRNRAHPDLAGLDRKTYQREYMKWKRRK